MLDVIFGEGRIEETAHCNTVFPSKLLISIVDFCVCVSEKFSFFFLRKMKGFLVLSIFYSLLLVCNIQSLKIGHALSSQRNGLIARWQQVASTRYGKITYYIDNAYIQKRLGELF